MTADVDLGRDVVARAVSLFNDKAYQDALALLDASFDDVARACTRNVPALHDAFRVLIAGGDFARASLLVNRGFPYLACNTAFGNNDGIIDKHTRPVRFASIDAHRLAPFLSQGANLGITLRAGEVYYHVDAKSRGGALDLKRIARIHHVFTGFVDTFPVLAGEIVLCLGDVCWLDGPVLSGCSSLQGSILVPDPIYMGTEGYRSLCATYRRNFVPFTERKPVFFWRGSTTGHKSSDARWRELPRARLCAAGAPHSDCDFGLSSVAQFRDQAAKEDLLASGLMKPEVPIADFMQYRYHVDIDGNSNSWPGLFAKLACGAAVIKVASAGGYRQWFYDRLRAHETIIPVAADLNDLDDALAWVRGHATEVEALAARAHDLAGALSYENALSRYYAGIEEALARSPGESFAFARAG